MNGEENRKSDGQHWKKSHIPVFTVLLQCMCRKLLSFPVVPDMDFPPYPVHFQYYRIYQISYTIISIGNLMCLSDFLEGHTIWIGVFYGNRKCDNSNPQLNATLSIAGYLYTL